MKACPACNSTEGKQEPGEYALLQLTQGKLTLDVSRPNNSAVVVRATTCGKCGFVALYEAA
jgi:hypothetical protein